MIVFDKLWLKMKEKGISQYALTNTFHIGSGQITRLKRNEGVSTHTLNALCEILDCELSDIAEYKKDENSTYY